MDAIETEVKFFIDDIVALRRRLAPYASLCSERVFEANVLFDAPDGRIRKSDCLLRIRRDRGARVTFKSPVDDPGRQVKAMREIETEIGDADAMTAVFEALGYRPVRTYEKWRETHTIDGCHVCVDELPFGDFVELEGEEASIVRLAAELGLSWTQRILLNYQELFSIVKTALGLDFDDISFSAFEGIDVDMRRYRHRFETGDLS